MNWLLNLIPPQTIYGWIRGALYSLGTTWLVGRGLVDMGGLDTLVGAAMIGVAAIGTAVATSNKAITQKAADIIADPKTPIANLPPPTNILSR